jgi:ATP-binding cassette, subfamily B, bacterial CvaB/MchF/RaxB
MSHFVVLQKVKSRHVVIHDPARGIRTLTFDEASKHFTGVALEVAPTPEFKPRVQKQRVSLSHLFGRLVGVKGQMTQIFIISLALQVAALFSPLYIQTVVDHALVSGDKDLITLLSIGFFFLVIVQVGIGALRSWVVLKLGTEMGVQWSVNVFAHLIRLPQTFFEKRHLGDILSRFGSISAIQRTLTTSFIEGIIDSILAILSLAMMLLYSTTLTVIVLISVVLYGLIRMIAYAPLRQATEESIVLGAKQQSTMMESLRGIQAIKLFARESQRQVLWHNHLIDTTNRTIKTQRFMLGYHMANGTLSGVANIAVVWLGAHQILGNTFSIGMLFAFLAYKTVFTGRMMGLIDKFIELKMLSLQSERLADIVLTPKENQQTENSFASATTQVFPRGMIKLDNVDFRYSELDPYVLRAVTLSIPEGKSVAIVGPSGCGKTTLAKLILGLLKPTEGRLIKGDTDLNRVDLTVWRSKVDAVMQDDQLFAGSIIDNICFFDESPDMDRLVHVAKLACIHGDIENMNMGYNTLVGDMGAAMSGGQKQRLLLARALYREPEVVVLDEATSHLDVALEKAINQAIQSLSMTRIVIAHRPETIASCDVVIHLPLYNKASKTS